MLALVIEATAGTTYRDYLAKRILPLPDDRVAGGFWDGEPAAPGARAIGYDDGGRAGQTGDFEGPHWALDGNGDLAMTVEHLAAWTHALFSGQIVSEKATAILAAPGFDQGEGRGETPGWVADNATFGAPLLGAAGGGSDTAQNAVVVWLPETEQVIAIASNTAKVNAEALAQEIGPAIAVGEPVPALKGAEGVDDGAEAGDLDLLSGTYRLASGGAFEVAVDEPTVRRAVGNWSTTPSDSPPPALQSRSGSRSATTRRWSPWRTTARASPPRNSTGRSSASGGVGPTVAAPDLACRSPDRWPWPTVATSPSTHPGLPATAASSTSASDVDRCATGVVAHTKPPSAR